LNSFTFCFKLFGHLYPEQFWMRSSEVIYSSVKGQGTVASMHCVGHSRFEENFQILLEALIWGCLSAKQPYRCVYGDWQHRIRKVPSILLNTQVWR